MNKSKEEILEDVKKYVPETIVALVCLDGPELMQFMQLQLDRERRHMEEVEKAYARCEKAYEEYQKYARLVKQVTKEES